MAFGDVIWANLPPPEGHAQAGTRPAILVQADGDDARLNTRTVVPITANPNAARFPGTLPIRATLGNGLRQDSTIPVAVIMTLDKAKVGGRLGRLDDEAIVALKAQLRMFLQLEEPKGTLRGLVSRLWSRLRPSA